MFKPSPVETSRHLYCFNQINLILNKWPDQHKRTNRLKYFLHDPHVQSSGELIM